MRTLNSDCMSESAQIYSKAVDSEEKFDYFICGVAGALFAYQGQHYLPHRLALNWNLFEPLSLLLLAASFFTGLVRIRKANLIKKINVRAMEAYESYIKAIEALKGPGPFHQGTTGKILSAEELRQEAEHDKAAADYRHGELQKVIASARIWYNARDWLLLAGFISILVFQLGSAYSPAPVTAPVRVVPSKP